jgi:hypothetical protein
MSFKNCRGFDIRVKTHWHSSLSVTDNLKLILDQNHYCSCLMYGSTTATQEKHVMERPIIADSNGFIYYQSDLMQEGSHYVVKTLDEYQREQHLLQLKPPSLYQPIIIDDRGGAFMYTQPPHSRLYPDPRATVYPQYLQAL